jgi:hypothetical protein
MAGKRFQGDHGCCRDRADGSCALAMVRRLSEERARRVQGRGDVTVVKLRPLVPGELAQPPWAVRHIAEENRAEDDVRATSTKRGH